MKSLLKNDLTKFIIYPVIVCLTIYLIQTTFSNIFNDREISYSIDKTRVITIERQNGVTRLENGTEKKVHFAHSVSFKNSGVEPLENVKIQYELLSEFDDLNIIDVYQPESRFGEIGLENLSKTSATFNYKLINPDQEWVVGVIHNKPAKLKVNINHRGLVLNKLTFLETLPAFMIVILLVLISALAFSLYLPIRSNKNLPTKEQWEELQVAWDYYIENVKNKEDKHLLTDAKTP